MQSEELIYVLYRGTEDYHGIRNKGDSERHGLHVFSHLRNVRKESIKI